MALVGAKPKPDGMKVNRVQPVHDWVDVQDVPYTGPVPDPGRMSPKGRPARWWATISSMPHCVLWGESDWQFALDTLALYKRFAARGEGASELRIREKILGTTIDARRDLRIRYIPLPDAEEKPDNNAPTDFAAARRGRIMGRDAE